MKNIPADFDLTFLIGKEVNQICFGAHQLQVNLFSNITISIECKTEYFPENSLSPVLWSPGDFNPIAKLPRLINSSITSFKIKDESLIFFFSNNDKLVLFLRNDGLESFQISEGKKIIVV